MNTMELHEMRELIADAREVMEALEVVVEKSPSDFALVTLAAARQQVADWMIAERIMLKEIALNALASITADGYVVHEGDHMIDLWHIGSWGSVDHMRGDVHNGRLCNEWEINISTCYMQRKAALLRALENEKDGQG